MEGRWATKLLKRSGRGQDTDVGAKFNFTRRFRVDCDESGRDAGRSDAESGPVLGDELQVVGSILLRLDFSCFYRGFELTFNVTDQT